MELSFVVVAIRRYWWVVVVCTLLGTFAGTQLRGTATTEFSSTAILLVSEPSASATGEPVNSGSDRYVLGQLSVLSSTSLAASVADTVGGGLTSTEVTDSTEIVQVPGTDVITITVTTGDSRLAETVAKTFVTKYFDALDDQIDEAQADDVTSLENQLTDISNRLADVDAKIVDVFKQYPPVANVAIPTLEQVAPELSSQRSILLDEYDRVAIAKDALVLNVKLRVTSKIVQEASPAEEVGPGARTLLPAAGFVSGLMLGMALAALISALSRKASDHRQIEEVLGQKIAAELPRARVFSTSRRSIVEAVPERVAARIDELAVLAESRADVGTTFTVLVTGVERSSGGTTLAGVLASHYASNGSQVLLVDADARDSELTRLFAAGSAGIEGLLTGHTGTGRLDPFSPTSVPGLSVVGVGDKTKSRALRRQNIPSIIEAASQHAHVVVFDGGPLLDAASTVQLAQMVDAVVVAVPMRRLFTKSLATVASQLEGRVDNVLPVLVPSSRRRRRGAVDALPPAGPMTHDELGAFGAVSERV